MQDQRRRTEDEGTIAQNEELKMSDTGPSSFAFRPSSVSTSPFDTMAADYDAAFTYSLIGERMRQAVWQRLAAHLEAGDCVLELGCGTGEDAMYLARRGVRVHATDVSAGMLSIAREKIRRAGLGQLVAVEQLNIADLGRFGTGGQGDRGTPEQESSKGLAGSKNLLVSVSPCPPSPPLSPTMAFSLILVR
jgi:predicted TPR repeat methyltransferase